VVRRVVGYDRWNYLGCMRSTGSVISLVTTSTFCRQVRNLISNRRWFARVSRRYDGIAAFGAVAILAVPAAAMVAPPKPATDFGYKDNTTYDQSNIVAQYSARITHNGWSVGGNKHGFGYDNTTDPGSRGDAVQGQLGHSS
jgi:hypothetical protein